MEPHLISANGAMRDAANLAVGFVFQHSADAKIFALLQESNLEDRRGASTNYPLGLGLAYQSSADDKVAAHLAEMFGGERRRLAHYAALGLGLTYQGTARDQAVELLLPMLEKGELDPTCIALEMIDFDGIDLAVLPRFHGVADGPGAARVFVLKHFIETSPNRAIASGAWRM